jgi:hypothetical protein
MIDIIKFKLSSDSPEYLKYIAKEYEILKQLNRTRVRKTYFTSLFATLLNVLL